MIDLCEVHEQLLDILLEFDRICRKYDIKYTLAWGTMLGAVRHKGFIPWDGDVDILMMRDEYERFCRVCSRELGKNYFFQTKENEPLYRYNVARIRKNGTAMIYKGWKDVGFHQGIYIDVQPLDCIPDGRIRRFFQKAFIVINTPVRISVNPKLYTGNGTDYSKFIKNIIFYIARIMPKKLCDKIEYYFTTKYNNKKVKCSKIGVICEGGLLLKPTRDMIPFNREYMNDYEEVTFEGHNFMCVKARDELLSFWYGDYMELPPENERIIDHDLVVFDASRSYKEYLREGVI